MTQERYEQIGSTFLVIDPELGLNLKGEVSQAHLHGPSIFYNSNGQLLSQTWYFEGKKVGKVHRYYSNGKLYSRERFLFDLPHLAQEYFYPDGCVKTIVQYNHGTLDGETVLNWPNGNLKRKCSFSDGKKVTDAFYNEEGSLIEDVERALS